MKLELIKKTGLVMMALVTVVTSAYAGNPDRRGQAGGTELLMVPWARSAGWLGVNTSMVRGLEAERMNVAGLAFTKGTELNFSRTTWLSGTDIFINAFGIAQRINESSSLAFTVMSIDMGAIDITTTENPDGGLGTYKPSFSNIGISYAKSFSDRIHGGATVRIISQSISDVSAQGVAFDAGIQYVTGPKDAVKFGISLRNVGTPMAFGGDGLSSRGTMQGNTVALTLSQRSQQFELPSLMNIGASYDFYPMGVDDYRLTAAGNFTSHSFTNDQYGVGLEFSWKNIFAIRSGYQYEANITGGEFVSQNVYTGFNVGFSIDAPFNKSNFGLDYAYRATNPFGGTHLLGIRYSL